jgi:lipid A oxidase
MTIARGGARNAGWGAPEPTWAERIGCVTAAACLAVWIWASDAHGSLNALDAPAEDAKSAPSAGPQSQFESTRTREYVLGAYGGVSQTHQSDVTISKPGSTDLTVRDFNWIGRPFKSPIYYGLRVQRWPAGSSLGTMVDFTHAKAIAQGNDRATFSGFHNGRPLPPQARLGEVFKHLEFSHGHNMVTLNGLVRSPVWWSYVRPYFGLGLGVSLPHTEVGLRGENARTYEYQFAGGVGQVLAGLELTLGRTSLFMEYKFSYAPYDVPLSHEPYGWVLVTDLWRQGRAWLNSEEPPGGRLRTTLATHHGISGLLVRTRTPEPAI